MQVSVCSAGVIVVDNLLGKCCIAEVQLRHKGSVGDCMCPDASGQMYVDGARFHRVVQSLYFNCLRCMEGGS